VRYTTASGRYAIIAIAVLAIGGATFNWWYQRDLRRRSLDMWGAPLARLIVQAPEVEAMLLAPAGSGAAPQADAEDGNTITIDGDQWIVIDRARIDTPEQAPGSTHVRRSLVNDRSFVWDQPVEDCRPDWRYALFFRDGDQEETILIALDCPRVALLGSNIRATITPVVPPLKEFFDEQFPGSVPDR
jgi:hypothetical protein